MRRIAVVTTHGSSKWTNALQGEPGKRLELLLRIDWETDGREVARQRG